MKSGTYSNDTTSAISASDVLLAVAEIIKQCIPDCYKIKAVLSARLPVVRFYHKSSDMRCDISLSNHLAVHNTKYLRFCWQLYPNFRPLVFVVRAWMKHWELAGETTATTTTDNLQVDVKFQPNSQLPDGFNVVAYIQL